MIQAALPEVSRKRLVAVPSRILGPRMEGCTRAPVQSHDARFASLVFLIRIHPAYAINFALLVVHTLDERPNSVARQRRREASIDVRKDQLHII